MIIESPAALRLVAALTEVGAAGATREYLVKRADISTSSFYRLIGPLIDNGLINSGDARYSLAFDNPYCFRFKLWHDMERLYRLAPEDRDMVLGVASVLGSKKEASLRTLWLVGSASRNELEKASDLDLLLVTKQLQPPLEAGMQRRKIAIIQMTEVEFRDAIQKADGFVVSALQTGVVLIDDGFAQQFYVTPPPVRINVNQARQGDVTATQQRERVLSGIESDDLEQARTALRNQGTHVGRLLLRSFGALPNNRIQLVEMSKQYFGARWARTLEEAVLHSPKTKETIIRLTREISDWHDSFQSQADHLQRFSALATGSERTLEALCAQVFEELVPGGQVKPEDLGVDLRIVATSGPDYLIEFKSSREHVSEASIEDAIRSLERAARETAGARLIVVANSWVGKPPFEPVVGLYRGRGDRVASEQTRARLATLSGLQLLCAHNRYHLEELAPQVVLEDLFQEGRAAESENHARIIG